MHLLGLGGRQVNRYKAYDCFCRAHSAGLMAATHNRAVCKYMGYGCRQDEEEAVTQLQAAAESASVRRYLITTQSKCTTVILSWLARVKRARLMALVLSVSYGEVAGSD
jgi:hypothetical protein